jgi:hypothetical protein
MTKKLPDLKLCLLLDAIGCLSYAVPFLGEFSDAIWAPLSGFIFYFIFGNRLGAMGGLFSVVEELLPGFDFIPTFTISYFIRKREIQKDAQSNGLKVLR